MTNSNTQPTEAMFTKIADRYDRCNHWFSFGIDRAWRRRLAKALNARANEQALDICCGTGDMAFALLKYTPVRHVVGTDCSERMIQLAQEKRMLMSARGWMRHKTLRLRVDDAARLSFGEGAFDLVTCVFGLRNIPERGVVLKELYRVLRPGGRLGIAEFSLPAHQLLRGPYVFYLSRIMPALGKLVLRDGDALRYLAQSIHRWDSSVRLDTELTEAGLGHVHTIPLTGGIVTLTTAQKS